MTSRSPGPGELVVSINTYRISASSSTSTVVRTMRRLSRCCGLCNPGVSSRAIWASGAWTTPRVLGPLVCGFVRDDRNLLFKQSIEQCRLTDIRSSNNRDSAELHGVTDAAAPVTVAEPIDIRFHLCERNRAAPVPTVRFSLDRAANDRYPPEACGSSVATPEDLCPTAGRAHA